MNIKQIAQNLKKKYNTNDPIKIIPKLGISLVHSYGLKDDVNGVYQKDFGQPVIYINSNLSEREQRLVAAHELGHYILHPDVNTKFVENKTFLVKSRYERQADIFASELLLDDCIFENYKGCTLKEISMRECVYERFVQYKFNNL